jgi:hypothetical protein
MTSHVCITPSLRIGHAGCQLARGGGGAAALGRRTHAAVGHGPVHRPHPLSLGLPVRRGPRAGDRQPDHGGLPPRQLLEEVSAYEAAGLPVRRPNSMNRYGLILEDLGLAPWISSLVGQCRGLCGRQGPALTGMHGGGARSPTMSRRWRQPCTQTTAPHRPWTATTAS